MFLTNLYLQVGCSLSSIYRFCTYYVYELVVSYSGSCKELINIYKREYIHSKPHLVISEENHMDNATSTSPINQVADEPITDATEIIGNASSVEEIEQICSVVNAPPPTIPIPNP
jgi:hypothetical protein